MSARSLGRSIIECGRAGYDAFDRNQIARKRRRWKMDEDGEYQPHVHSHRGELRDHLIPLFRWLESNVGQPWSLVYSKFCAREDRRTLRGHHIHTHLKQYVSNTGGQEMSDFWNYRNFFVDRSGILRVSPPRVYRYRSVSVKQKEQKELETWAAGRKVTKEAGAWYWSKCVNPPVTIAGVVYKNPKERWAQSGRMSRADEAIWWKWTALAREHLFIRIGR